MTRHVTEWLDAYHDGELIDAHLRQVEQHLTACTECQDELDGMQGLSVLLHETAPIGEFMPTERFVTNLVLSLPRQPARSQNQIIYEIGWWLIPACILGTWVFLQITIMLGTMVLAVLDAGVLGSNFAWLQGNPPQAEWFSTIMNLSGGKIDVAFQGLLSILNNSDLFIENLKSQIQLQAFLAVLYLGWLVAWWCCPQRQSPKAGAIPQS